MMHDFALTERYVVVYDLPVTFDIGMVTRTMPRPCGCRPSWRWAG